MGGDRKTVRQVSQVLVKSECVENFSDIAQSTQQGHLISSRRGKKEMDERQCQEHKCEERGDIRGKSGFNGRAAANKKSSKMKRNGKDTFTEALGRKSNEESSQTALTHAGVVTSEMQPKKKEMELSESYCEEEWQEVKSKKTRNKRTIATISPVQSITEPVNKKENFERLITTLNSEFPDSNRNTIVEAYNEVKKIHTSFDGQDLNFIKVEVSRVLKRN